MLELTLPWWELVLRGAAVYVMVLGLMRLSGKRQLGQLTPFDLVMLMLISEAASNALTAEENSWLGALIVVTTMLMLNVAIGLVTTRSARAERLMEGRPRFLVRQGRVQYRTLREETISNNELMAALRQNGCFTPGQAEYAILETTGKISVKRRGETDDAAPNEAPLAG